MSDEKLEKAFVTLPETATLAQALEALVQAHGEGWWTLLAVKGDGSIVATTFNKISEKVNEYGPALFTAPLPNLPVRWEKCDVMDAARVSEQTLEHRDAMKMLVVTEQGVPVRRIKTIRLADGAFASTSLVQLYGEYVQLRDDERAKWKPSGKEPPKHRCGKAAWPELAANGKWVCSACKMVL